MDLASCDEVAAVAVNGPSKAEGKMTAKSSSCQRAIEVSETM